MRLMTFSLSNETIFFFPNHRAAAALSPQNFWALQEYLADAHLCFTHPPPPAGSLPPLGASEKFTTAMTLLRSVLGELEKHPLDGAAEASRASKKRKCISCLPAGPRNFLLYTYWSLYRTHHSGFRLSSSFLFVVVHCCEKRKSKYDFLCLFT